MTDSSTFYFHGQSRLDDEITREREREREREVGTETERDIASSVCTPGFCISKTRITWYDSYLLHTELRQTLVDSMAK